MSITSTTRKAGPFAGDGATVTFPFAFKVFTTADVVVTQQTIATGAEAVLTLGVDYTVALNGNQDAAPGGSITMTVAPSAAVKLTITSGVSALQQLVITNGGGFFPSNFNDAFDRLTILVQQNTEKLSRALTASLFSSIANLNVPVLANGVLQWSADGTQLTAITLPDLSLNLALPADAGHAGQFLTTDGAGHKSWAAVTGFVPTATTVTGGGLVTGGGALTGNLTLTVSASSASDIRTGTDATKANTSQALAGAAAFQTLTNAATIAWDTNLGYNAQIVLTGSNTIGAPTNLKDGWTYTLHINPATFTPVWNAIFEWGASGTPTLTASAVNIVTGIYNSGTGKIHVGVRK